MLFFKGFLYGVHYNAFNLRAICRLGGGGLNTDAGRYNCSLSVTKANESHFIEGTSFRTLSAKISVIPLFFFFPQHLHR